METDTFAGATVKWFINGVYTGVSLDTFYTTAPNDGDSVFCRIYVGGDSARSNAIVVHRAASIPAQALVSLIVGSNPDCAGNRLTFQVYPVNGGTNPKYQWMINGVEMPGEDSTTFSGIFGGADTISCRMVSNSECAPVDTVFSVKVPIIHIHLTETVNIITLHNPTCQYAADTFYAYAFDYGTAVRYQWYVDTTAVVGGITDRYITDSLRDGDSVYCVITSLDTCVLNPITKSNTLQMIVSHNQSTSAYVNLIHGANPGCLDSVTTFKAIYDSFGFNPFYEWTVNGVPTALGSDTISRRFNDGDIVSFFIRTRDGGCYTHDTITTPGIYMIRQQTPATPLVSLIGNMLVANDGTGTYRWYFNTVRSYTGATIIPGATGPTYHAVVLGYYFAVKDSLYCPSDNSNIIYISLLSVKEVFGESVKIYPNPTHGMLHFEWGGLATEMRVEVYNAAGIGVQYEKWNTASARNLDLTSLPNGTYYLVLRDSEGKAATHTFVIER
ncbi:MAG: T9SS C-terminal target domain-containing protein [Chitinophagia bacterium]|nr:T9SS C-terminal target domain-containing protein [Chitinophagia bacterium]